MYDLMFHNVCRNIHLSLHSVDVHATATALRGSSGGVRMYSLLKDLVSLEGTKVLLSMKRIVTKVALAAEVIR